jgi:hypothetical protein
MVVEDDLLALLDSGHLAGATLDVFRTEPLPAGHAFWHASRNHMSRPIRRPAPCAERQPCPDCRQDVGSLVAATCLVAVGDAHSRWGFYGAWAAMGAAMSAVLYSPVFAVVTRRFPADFRRAIITMTFLGGLASTVFIPLTAWLISVLGWRLAIQSLALLHVFVCAPLHALVLRGATTTSTRAKGAVPVAKAWWQFVGSAPFLLVSAFLLMMTAVSSALPAHMVSLLREAGMHAFPRQTRRGRPPRWPAERKAAGARPAQD